MFRDASGARSVNVPQRPCFNATMPTPSWLPVRRAIDVQPNRSAIFIEFGRSGLLVVPSILIAGIVVPGLQIEVVLQRAKEFVKFAVTWIARAGCTDSLHKVRSLGAHGPNGSWSGWSERASSRQ